MIDHALLCLATTIYMESATEPKPAQVAVGYVLYRRADFDKNQICNEMKRPYQFSWYGKVRPPSEIREEYLSLARRILHRKEYDYSYGAINFHDTTIQKPKSWSRMKPIVRWSRLIFYKQEETKYASITPPIRMGIRRI